MTSGTSEVDPDEVDWDVERDGHMADYATGDDAVTTEVYGPDPTARERGPDPAARERGLDLPAALAARGVRVELVDGWRTRGASGFRPQGAVCHWTAGPAGRGDRPSLQICITGRADVPGPLCNVFLTRDGVAVVVAAGRANHAGKGGWAGLRGNSTVFGTEAENSGGGEWTEAQRAAYPRINAAYADLAGFGAEMVCGHHEWAPTRKIDINDWPMSAMRQQVAALLGTEPGAGVLVAGIEVADTPTTPEGDDEMAVHYAFVTEEASGAESWYVQNARAGTYTWLPDLDDLGVHRRVRQASFPGDTLMKWGERQGGSGGDTVREPWAFGTYVGPEAHRPKHA